MQRVQASPNISAATFSLESGSLVFHVFTLKNLGGNLLLLNSSQKGKGSGTMTLG